MKKNIACPKCNGRGYRTVITGGRNDYCGVASERCPICEGAGVQLVDMTNADRIRAMSDEKMVSMFMDMTINGVRPWCDFHCRKDGKYGCEKCILKWLQQTAEDE